MSSPVPWPCLSSQYFILQIAKLITSRWLNLIDYHLLPSFSPSIPSRLILCCTYLLTLITTKSPNLPDHTHSFPYPCVTLVYLCFKLPFLCSFLKLSLCPLELSVCHQQNFYPHTLLWWFISPFFSHRNLAFIWEYCFFLHSSQKVELLPVTPCTVGPISAADVFLAYH